MYRLSNDILCKYYLGCNKLENYSFKGTRNCKNFVSGYGNSWRKQYDTAVKNKLKENIKK